LLTIKKLCSGFLFLGAQATRADVAVRDYAFGVGNTGFVNVGAPGPSGFSVAVADFVAAH
jgi:hypothetical protein